jgi:hypothetical protein
MKIQPFNTPAHEPAAATGTKWDIPAKPPVQPPQGPASGAAQNTGSVPKNVEDVLKKPFTALMKVFGKQKDPTGGIGDQVANEVLNKIPGYSKGKTTVIFGTTVMRGMNGQKQNTEST